MPRISTYLLLLLFTAYIALNIQPMQKAEALEQLSCELKLDHNSACCLTQQDSADNTHCQHADDSSKNNCCDDQCCCMKIITTPYIATTTNDPSFNFNESKYGEHFVFSIQQYSPTIYTPPQGIA